MVHCTVGYCFDLNVEGGGDGYTDVLALSYRCAM
jgi:hypothetical protein